MKNYLSTALALVCAVLVIALVVIKRGDNAQHESDAGTIVGVSNQLTSALGQIAAGNGTILTLSNRLDECQSASATLSNHLTEAESTIALNTEQIANLSRQVAEADLKNQTLNQTLGQQLMDLTNQLAGLASQTAVTESNLAQANKSYALLEERLRRDVAERLVMQRKFYSPSALEAQIEYLKIHPIEVISTESIYAGLDVEVNSNRFHVLSPD